LKHVTQFLLAGAMLLQPMAASTSDAAPRQFLLRVADVEIYLQPTAGPNTVNNCLIVYPDGQLHMELRRQEFFFGSANYTSFEGQLSKPELTILRSILDSRDLRKLPPPPSPNRALSSSHIQWFTAEIHTEESVRVVGTSTWEGEPKRSEAEQAISEQERAVLEPLVHWSRSIKGMNRAGWRLVENSDSVCGE
jgi:hypothetical protein